MQAGLTMQTQAVPVSPPNLVSLTPPPPSAQCSTHTDIKVTYNQQNEVTVHTTTTCSDVP